MNKRKFLSGFGFLSISALAYLYFNLSESSRSSAESSSLYPNRGSSSSGSIANNENRDQTRLVRERNLPPAREGSKEVAQILADESSSDDEAALKLLDFARGPGREIPARLESLEHALNLVSDQTFKMGFVEFALDERTPAILSETIFDDLLSRGDRLQAISYLQFALKARGKIAKDAEEELQHLLGADPAIPANQLESRVQQWLNENEANP